MTPRQPRSPANSDVTRPENAALTYNAPERIMSVGHYENFPVASLLLPRHLRAPVAVIYRFARSADDIADEGNAAPAERLSALEAYRRGLFRIEHPDHAGEPNEPAWFGELAAVIRQHALDLQPFHDLLSAFSQDVTTTRYRDNDSLLDYCRRSANPVGRLMLQLYRADDAANRAEADRICTALQLTNFWQDVAVDLGKGRIYLPQHDMDDFGVIEGELRERCEQGRPTGGSIPSSSAPPGSPDRWRDLMRFEVERTRELMLEGAPLALRLPGRIGLELRLVVQGGLRILEKIEQADYDVFRHRPKLAPADWLPMLRRAAAMKPR